MSWEALVQIHKELPSTNDLAKELARQGAPEGTTVIARRQTAGRGRLGRSFHSPEGTGLYMSVVLRPHCAPQELMHLTCAVAVAACDAVEATARIRPGIKWINDLVTDGKKLGGILTELGFSGKGTVDYAVIGISIALSPDDFRPKLGDVIRQVFSDESKTLSTRLTEHILLEFFTIVIPRHQHQLTVDVQPRLRKAIEVPQRIPGKAVVHHLAPQLRIGGVHRHVDGADVHLDDALQVVIGEVGQRNVVAEQEGQTAVVILKV